MSRSPRTWGWTAAWAELAHPIDAFPTHVGMDRRSRGSAPRSGSVPHARGDGPAPGGTARWRAPRSPRTWGWTGQRGGERAGEKAFPTHVGMDRPRQRAALYRGRVPHARGDGPLSVCIVRFPPARSPRTWGWTDEEAPGSPIREAFPTHVGMDRWALAMQAQVIGVPHARGDGPRERAVNGSPMGRSPRTWGWTAADMEPDSTPSAFPTHVGMDRRRCRLFHFLPRVPHARGDGPPEVLRGRTYKVRSPRTWGWTGLGVTAVDLSGAFPTHVGMDRLGCSARTRLSGVPHARGDGPRTRESMIFLMARSPRTWGWTVPLGLTAGTPAAFPTHVGMDRSSRAQACPSARVPHARGDGPIKQEDGLAARRVPHARGDGPNY